MKKLTSFTLLVFFLLFFGISTSSSAKELLPSLTLNAEAGLLVEAKTGTLLFGKNENAEMYPASLTKVATAIFALEKGNPEDLVTISEHAALTEGSSVYLTQGEQLPLGKLISGFLINSGNDAGVAIAEHISGSEKRFAKELNIFLEKEIGVIDTNFTNPHGLFDKNHKTTAGDLAKITAYAMKNEKFREIFATKELPWDVKTWNTTILTHHRLLKGEINYEGITGGKTGYVTESGNTLITTASRGNLDLIAVTLKTTSAKDAYKDTIALLDYGFNHYDLGKINKGQTFTTNQKVFTLQEELYYTYEKGETPVIDIQENERLAVKKTNGIVTTTFDLHDVATVEDLFQANSEQASSQDTSLVEKSAFPLGSYAFGLILVILFTFIFRFYRINKKVK